MNRDCNCEADEEKQKTVQDLLVEYGGYPLDLDRLSDYDRAALAFFTNPDTLLRSRMHITTSLDVTAAHSAFVDLERPGDTFTGRLTWGLLAAMKRHPYASWRYVQGAWYAFDDLPLFFPVATGVPGYRLDSITLEHVAAEDWNTFSRKYRSALDRSRSCCWSMQFGDQLRWSVSHFIGNLPGIQFTCFVMPETGIETTRPIFYFGHRYEEQGRLYVPFTAQFHHATLDPVLLGELLSDFQEILVQKS